ncbi:Smr/MutS family protein [Jannaschia sp. CCS1]|uniref:Smr/MutS family protein n=1 Tax=Jannaschia sp. (strain CCS1) TaxID=290400 RepID=UPI000053C806|nr:Smr/MutS family protein [Jannaschia sp. CCS1]ABD53106.1 Smr protein/MutS2 [Jannaschia sp. CCS1]
MARRGKRGLSADDKAIWEKVAATATPMDRSGVPKITEETLPKKTPPLRPQPSTTADRLPAFRVGEKSSFNKGAVNHAPSLSVQLAHAPVRMDHGTHKRMTRGKLKPEGRIDLHGMTLSEAHPALISFIFHAHEAERRLVLVITGKGKDRDSGGPIPIRRGILKHQIPNWLTSPPLGAMILDIREAHQRHGGGGAYYVYLKRRR